jgi:acyl-[acyl-carrier-protein]-phospholipid O-acyltransferase/long-chain-fatty-acid--[acyl-carrier-protein] ligase
MEKKSFNLQDRAGVFSIYLVILFVNAFVDVSHKQIIISTIYKLSGDGPQYLYNESTQIIMTAVVSAMILIPFIALFTLSGYLSDRFAKPSIMRWAAFSAVIITLGIAYAYYQGEFELAFGLTLLLATQSAIYSPAKYGYIKECLGEKGLSIGNAYLMSVTLISILLATAIAPIIFEQIYLADYLAQMPDDYVFSGPGEILQVIAPMAWVLVGLSVIEFISTFGLKFYATKYQEAKLSVSKLLRGGYLREHVRDMRANQVTWYAILGTAVFWSISQNMLAVLPAHAKANLHIESVALLSLLMAISIVGIIIGSYASSKNSQKGIRVNNVYYGAIILIVCAGLIPAFSVPALLTETSLGFELMGDVISLGLALTVATIFVFGIGAGMLIVPLNALIQSNAEPDNLGSVIAGKNWVQNIAMVGLLCITGYVAYNNVNSEYILYFNAVIALVGFSVVLKKLKSIY